MPNNEVPAWVSKHNEQNKIEDAEANKFFKFPEGETEILIDINEAPKEVTKFSKTRYQYQIFVNPANEKDGQIKTLEVGKQLDRQIVKCLIAGKNPMTVIRIGSDINSKYSIKGLK